MPASVGGTLRIRASGEPQAIAVSDQEARPLVRLRVGEEPTRNESREPGVSYQFTGERSGKVSEPAPQTPKSNKARSTLQIIRPAEKAEPRGRASVSIVGEGQPVAAPASAAASKQESQRPVARASAELRQPVAKISVNAERAIEPPAPRLLPEETARLDESLPLPREADASEAPPSPAPLQIFKLSFSEVLHDAQAQQPRKARRASAVARTQDIERAPPVLRPPDEWPRVEPEPDPPVESEDLFVYPIDPPSGFTGPSGVLPSEEQESAHFVPMEDRWRSGFPEWDRYGRGHPLMDDYPYVTGNFWNSYKQNVIKGDYPIIGQHTFLSVTLTNQTLFEMRQVPTATTPFESTERPDSADFFGNPNQFLYLNNFIASFDLSHGDAAFKPADWRLRLTPIFNINYLGVNELAVVNPNVEEGLTRFQDWFSLQEWFAEAKLADLSPDYDFVSARVGSQPFNTDFRGLLFADTNRAIRLFGTRLANRDQFNVIYFDQAEKDTNSALNTFHDRHQNTLLMNYYKQDFIWPGYTAQVNFAYDHDKASFKFDRDDILVRPDPVGVALPHSVNAYYLGWTGDGHINRFNINHAFYQALGRDSLNPLAGQKLNINAQMAALELSYDRDWVRFRASAFYTSGDRDITDNRGQGFDTIFDNPNFAGGQFSYWQRQTIRLLGVNLTQRFSLVPDLRSSKIEGQPNFVNPGIELANVGMDFEVTPKARLISNANFLWFDNTNVLEQFVFQQNIRRNIGADLSLGLEYRPWLNNRGIITAGVSGLIPGQGFKDLYNPIVGDVGGLFASFIEMNLSY